MTLKLEKYIGKVFIHTKKAIRKGHPANRLFYVVKVETDPDGDPTQFLCAWKIDKITNELFLHPAFVEPHRIWVTSDFLCHNINEKPVNFATPTATFIPDSYYKEVTLEQAMKELKCRDTK